jgi:GT2 family glycosyltransferase
MTDKKVTILVPNYKTPEITKICLRLLRKYTNHDLANVIVLDNNSQDESIEYLRTLNWITLIERDCVEGESGVQAHSRALDLALEKVTTPYVLSIHTDTFVKRPDWLEVLLAQFDSDEVAGVGSWKLESKNVVRRAGIKLEQSLKYLLHKLFGYKRYNPNRLDTKSRYLRSHCAMYKMDVIKAIGTNFSDGDSTAGKIMHHKIKDAGYKMKFLRSEFLGKYVDHLNHATSILNPELRRQGKTSKKEYKKVTKQLRGINAEKILNSNNLDV